MEGCSLIKKVGKNLYSWIGKTYEPLNSKDEESLYVLKDDQKQLNDEEQQLNEFVYWVNSEKYFAKLFPASFQF